MTVETTPFATFTQGPDALSCERATIYHMSAFGAARVEVAACDVAVKGPREIRVQFREPRKRTTRAFTVRDTCLVILGGHGHPDHPTGDPTPDGRGTVSRYCSFAPEWRPDFDQFLERYLKANPGVRVLGDYRQEVEAS